MGWCPSLSYHHHSPLPGAGVVRFVENKVLRTSLALLLADRGEYGPPERSSNGDKRHSRWAGRGGNDPPENALSHSGMRHSRMNVPTRRTR